ncbi:hypothetical protein CEP54_016020 [Fusarium duplospermum]|uniref:Uncharacterized protein n=1 Tax=Fusarium duplospermum TaxID=1325734 RepID=A0A428NJ13_9HYPO|nr:hypothetical protein CEP54_016020 [Fusarium duplospermum]
MASPEDTKKLVEELGCFYQEDPELGRRVDAIFQEVGYYFKNAPGLTFTKVNTFDNEKVRYVIESFFPECSLGIIKSYGPSDYDCCWMNRLQSELQVLMVHLWSSNSVAIFHLGSHKHLLGADRAPNGLLKIPPEKLGLPGIISKTVPMKKGGMSILDGRTGFRIVSGRAIFFAFVVPNELQYWAKMELPQGCGLEEIVQQIQETSDHIGANFKFKAPEGSDTQ